ncbi:MAG: vWA domain-containing protein [Planctomycetaceae bacterium]
MSFVHPMLLFLLVVPALLLAWIWRRGGERIVLPFDHGGAPRGHWLKGTIDVAESLPAVVLAVAIVLLAGPQKLGEPKLKRVLTNIELCVDISGSMTAPFGEGSRYDASMKAIDEFLDARQGDAFGLTFFGNSVLHWVPLTSDVSAIRCAPPFMRPEKAPPWFGGTAIGKALLACKDVLATREEGDRLIVLVSDGYSFDLGGENDLEIAATLRRHGIAVYGIHISETEIPEEIINIARFTGGDVFRPDDPDGLRDIFHRIDEMQETKLESTAAETMDDFGPVATAGLALLGLGVVSLYGVRYTPW